MVWFVPSILCLFCLFWVSFVGLFMYFFVSCVCFTLFGCFISVCLVPLYCWLVSLISFIRLLWSLWIHNLLHSGSIQLNLLCTRSTVGTNAWDILNGKDGCVWQFCFVYFGLICLFYLFGLGCYFVVYLPYCVCWNSSLFYKSLKLHYLSELILCAYSVVW